MNPENPNHFTQRRGEPGEDKGQILNLPSKRARNVKTPPIIFAKLVCGLIGLIGFLFFAAGFLIRLSVWNARHIEGTRASMVSMQTHFIGFAMTLLPCLFFGLVAVAPFWCRRKWQTSNLEDAQDVNGSPET